MASHMETECMDNYIRKNDIGQNCIKTFAYAAI